MGLFDIFRKKEIESIESLDDLMIDPEELSKISSEEILDTTSTSSIIKFKHNLELLVKQAKKKKKIEKFATIRDDNLFPEDYEWKVASSITTEENSLLLSSELRKYIALKKANIQTSINGISIPVNQEKIEAAMKKIDKSVGNVLLPVKFRSTKHFTVNTPLEVTGDYNTVSLDRTFTIIDDISPFLESGYAYSLAYHDAYLDVSHESLKISPNAVVLIEQSKYESIKNNKEIMEQLEKRKVIIYKGEEYLAIDMVLSEMGILPSKVGEKYITYDEEINQILDQSIRNLASNNGIKYDISHGGTQGHFTSRIDDMNNEYSNYLEQFTEFLRRKFPLNCEFITTQSINNQLLSQKLIQLIGANKLLDAINEYNELAKNQEKQNKEEYKKDRSTITPEISQIFKTTLKQLEEYYSINSESNEQLDRIVQHFLQDKTVREQLKASSDILKTIGYYKEDEINIHK